MLFQLLLYPLKLLPKMSLKLLLMEIRAAKRKSAQLLLRVIVQLLAMREGKQVWGRSLFVPVFLRDRVYVEVAPPQFPEFLVEAVREEVTALSQRVRLR